MSDAPARRSLMVASPPWSGGRAVDGRVVGVLDVDLARPACAARRATRCGPRRSPRGRATCPVAWVSRTQVGGWRSVAKPGIGRGLDVAARAGRRAAGRWRRSRSCVSLHAHRHADPVEQLDERRRRGGRPRSRASALPPVTAAPTRNVPVSIRSGIDGVLRPAQPARAVDLDRVGVGPRDVRAHRAEERDQVVDLGLLRGRPDDRVARRRGVAASIAFSVPITVTCGKR